MHALDSEEDDVERGIRVEPIGLTKESSHCDYVSNMLLQRYKTLRGHGGANAASDTSSAKTKRTVRALRLRRMCASEAGLREPRQHAYNEAWRSRRFSFRSGGGGLPSRVRFTGAA